MHVEVQSQGEAGFARRMYVYNNRIFERYNRQVASLAVLADDRPNWRPDRWSYILWGCEVSIRFPIVKLLDFSDDAALEASPNPFATVVRAHLRTIETRQDPVSRGAWKIRLVRSLYERGFDRTEITGLFRFIDWIMDLPKELETQFNEEVRALEGQHMPYLSGIERDAKEKGREEGREKGREEGREEGLRLGLRLGIQKLLATRFGDAGLALLPAVEALASTEQLEQCHTLSIASSLDEIRTFLGTSK